MSADEKIPERDVNFPDYDDDVCRLQRKDTPHHLKGKRIVKDDDDTHLQNILQTIRQKSVEETQPEQQDENDEEKKENGDDVKINGSSDVMDGPTEEQIEDQKRGRACLL